MSPHRPEDWPGCFEHHLNAGDLDAVVALYEPDARFVSRSGDVLVGRDRIRTVLSDLIAARTHMKSRVVKAVAAGDIALLSTDFERTTLDASGRTIAIRDKALEVLRRQPDGTWKLIVGDPQGRD